VARRRGASWLVTGVLVVMAMTVALMLIAALVVYLTSQLDFSVMSD
jgi:hypothetical protein